MTDGDLAILSVAGVAICCKDCLRTHGRWNVEDESGSVNAPSKRLLDSSHRSARFDRAIRRSP
ncbi:hypothetical protein EMIT047CA2_50190 [Pseudomonas soli]